MRWHSSSCRDYRRLAMSLAGTGPGKPNGNQMEKVEPAVRKKNHSLIFHASSPARFDGPCRKCPFHFVPEKRKRDGDTQPEKNFHFQEAGDWRCLRSGSPFIPCQDGSSPHTDHGCSVSMLPSKPAGPGRVHYARHRNIQPFLHGCFNRASLAFLPLAKPLSISTRVLSDSAQTVCWGPTKSYRLGETPTLRSKTRLLPAPASSPAGFHPSRIHHRSDG